MENSLSSLMNNFANNGSGLFQNYLTRQAQGFQKYNPAVVLASFVAGKNKQPKQPQVVGPQPMLGPKQEVPTKTITTSQNLNPSGIDQDKLAYTAEVINNAKNLSNQYRGFSNMGGYDIDNYHKIMANMGDDASLQDLYSLRYGVNNRRNDIATGVVDPYEVAKNAGVVFSPEDQRDINLSAAKIYDPSLEDLNARILARENEGKTKNDSWDQGILAGLSNAQSNAIWNRVTNLYYDNPQVKTFQNEARAYSNIMSLDAATLNGPQKQAIVSDYAKYLDPNSVVREAEFIITGKHSQAGWEQIKENIRQFVYGDGFLTDDAVEAIQAATKNRFKTAVDNLNKKKSEVVRILNKSYGQRDYYELLEDMTPAGYDQNQTTGNLPPPTQDEIDALRKAGYSEQEINALLGQSGSGGGNFSKVGGGTDLATALTNAIMMHESGGRQVRGGSGEFGSFQYLPDTWKTISKEMTGKVLPQTPQNEYLVSKSKIAKLLQTYSPMEVALIWNTSLGGSEKPLIKKGRNSSSYNYDSLAYANAVMKQLYG